MKKIVTLKVVVDSNQSVEIGPDPYFLKSSEGVLSEKGAITGNSVYH